MTNIRIIIIAILLSVHFAWSEGADATDISRLRAVLLKNYDNNTRPVQSHHDTTVVNSYFYYSGFEFNEQKGLLTLHALVGLDWVDEHIQWNPLNYGNLTIIHFYPTELWKPDLASFWSAGEVDHFGNTLIYATNFTLIYAPPGRILGGCEVDYYRWPYDMHRCTIKIASYSHDGSEIFLTVPENHTKLDKSFASEHNQPLENREWNLVDNSIELMLYNYTFGKVEVTYSEIVITMDIQRKSPTHVAAVVVVAIGIASAILISFWLNPFAKERVPVILVAMFLNVMFLSLVHSIIPPNGNRAPWAVCYFRDSLIMVGVALAWTILLRYIANTKRNSQVPLPLWVDNVLDGFIGSILCLNPRPTVTNKNQETPKPEDSDDQNDLVAKELVYKDDWGWFANILDRIAFILYFLVYACFILSF